MVKKVQQYIQSLHMIESGDRIVIGVSGGADSVALLLILFELRTLFQLQLFVVHINHGIREEAKEDAIYVKQLCEKLLLPFYLYEADIPTMAKEQGCTEEEMGRLYRYRCFGEVMEKVGACKLAVAHHMDDQAETMLFHMVRGARLTGMEGMRPVTNFWLQRDSMTCVDASSTGRKQYIIRPLLCCRKWELVEWLQVKNISWKEDCTNTDNTYSRNCIRNQVIPVLEQINAKAVEHMWELVEEISAHKEFLQKAVNSYMQTEVTVMDEGENEELFGDSKKQVISACRCDRVHLLQQEKILANEVIYKMLAMVSGGKKDLSNVHVQAVYELMNNQSGKKMTLPYNVEAEISYEMLIIRKKLEEDSDLESFELSIPLLKADGMPEKDWELPNGMRLHAQFYWKRHYTAEEWKQLVEKVINSKNNYTKFFECDTINDTLSIRVARSDDYFVMHESGTRKRVSRYFIDNKIPIEQRKNTLVLANDDRVLWIIGRRRCEEYKVTDKSEMILQLTYEGEQR